MTNQHWCHKEDNLNSRRNIDFKEVSFRREQHREEEEWYVTAQENYELRSRSMLKDFLFPMFKLVLAQPEMVVFCEQKACSFV